MSLKLLETPALGQEMACFAFAHGAGAPMDAPFMETMTGHLTQLGIKVVRFEFPYMAERRFGGSRRPPNPQPVLLDTWREVIASYKATSPLFIGGKSMGGRMAAMVSEAPSVAGVICLGYPFHPTGRPKKLRLEPLQDLNVPALILQGTRDSLGNKEEVLSYVMGDLVEVVWFEDGDHDLKPRKKSGYDYDEHLLAAADSIAAFVRKVINPHNSRVN